MMGSLTQVLVPRKSNRGKIALGKERNVRDQYRNWEAGQKAMSDGPRDLYPVMELTEADNNDDGNEHLLSILRYFL